MFFTSSPGDGRLGILRILNLINDTGYELEDLEFGAPERNTDPLAQRNTRLSIVFRGDRGLYGVKYVYYNRIHSSELPTLEINRGLANTYHELIPALNAEFNLFLTEQDIVNGPLPGVQNAIITAVLTFTEQSFIFLPNPNINTQPFTPNYSLYRPEHTLLTYVCQGFDRYAEYSDNQGGTYRILQQTNSVVCGFNDSAPRIVIIPQGDLNTLEEEISDPFIIRVLNVSGPVQVTLVGPGLTFSQSVFNLSDLDDEASFTITSNHPGSFTINTTNNGGLANAEEIQYVFIDRYNTTYGLTLPPSLELFENQSSNVFTLTGYQIDPDEPITVTINKGIGLNLSEESVLLTSLEPSATFFVEPSSPGNYSISFTNNRGLTNPNSVNFLIRPEIELVLTPPLDPIVNGIESGLFTVELLNGLSSVLVTPEATGDVVITPSSFTLTPAQPIGTFRVTYNEEGSNEISLENNSSITNPAPYSFTVLPIPYITLVPPVEDIYNNQQSENWTLTLVNGYVSVNVTIATNVSSISNNSFTLTPGSPTATFTLTNNIEGDFYIEASNSRNYQITPRIDFTILRTLVPELRLTGPSVSRSFNESNDFTVQLLDYTDPVTVNINNLFNTTINPTFLNLSGANPIGTFTITGVTVGNRNVGITNNAGIPNPPDISHLVRQSESIVIEIEEGDFDDIIVGQQRTVTFRLANPYEPIDVTPIETEGFSVTFNPTNFSLTPAQPTREVVVTFNEVGLVGLSAQTTPYANITIAAYGEVQPVPPETLTLTPVSEGVFLNETSLPFTVNFLNATSNIVVSINSTAGTVFPTTLNLSPGNTSGTFTLTHNVLETVTISITNDGTAINPSDLNVQIQQDITNLIIGQPFNTTYNQGQTSEQYSIVAFDLARPMTVTLPTIAGLTFSQSVFNLTQENNSANFTITGINHGVYNFTTSNNRNVVNPPNVQITFLQVLNPEIILTSPAILNGISGVESGIFQVELIQATGDVTVNLNAFQGATNVRNQTNFSINEFVLNALNPIETFTITPSISGVIQITVTTLPSIINPNPVNYTVAPARSLTLTRQGSGNLTRDTKETFTVNLLNGTSENVEIIPLADTNIVLDDFTSPILLNSSNPIATFTARSDFVGLYSVGIDNLSGITNPSSINLNVINGAITLTAPNLNVLLGQESGTFTVTLVNYDFPTIVTLDIDTDINDYHINIDPSVYHDVDQLILTSANRVGAFTIDKDSVGILNITFSNNRGLTNPNSVNVNFFDSSEITIQQPTVTRNYAGTTIGNYTIEALDLVEPVEIRMVHDLLWDDPYKNNVVLALDMQNELGQTTFIDKSNSAHALTTVGSVQMYDSNPSVIIYGRSTLRLFSDAYINVTNLSNDFDFGLDDFTIELAVIFVSFSSVRCLIDTGEIGGNGFRLRIHTTRQLLWSVNNTNIIITTAIANDFSSPRKIVVSRSSGILKIIVDGTIVGSVADTNNYIANNSLVRIFANLQGGEIAQHYLGYLVITKGIDKYSSSTSFIDPKIPTPNKIVFNLDNINPSDTFNITTNSRGAYRYYFVNNNNLVNPSPIIATFENLPTIDISHPLSLPSSYVGGVNIGVNIGVNNLSDIFTVTLMGATLPVELTFSFESGLQLIPVNSSLLTGANTVTLDENQNIFEFRLLSENLSFGYNFNITNSLGIVNPATLLIRALLNTQISVNNPGLDVEYDKHYISLELTSTEINEPIFIQPISEQPDPFYENVSLLMYFQGLQNETIFRDESKNKLKITNINDSVAYDRTQPLYGKSSARFNQSLNSYLIIPRSDPQNTGKLDDLILDGDFTIEFSILPTTTSTTRTIIDSFNTSNINRWRLDITSTNGINISRSQPALTFGSVSLTSNQTHDVSLVRAGTSLHCFVGGILIQTLNTGSYIYGNTIHDYAIGATAISGPASQILTGLLGYIRITKGVARYLTNHVPYRPRFLKFNPELIIISSDNQTVSTNASSDFIDQFNVNFNNNNQNIVIDNYNNLEFITTPTISLNPPNSRLTEIGETSNIYTLSVSSAPIDIRLNIDIGSAQFVLEPTWSNSETNEIIFDTNNTSVQFSITSNIIGVIQISITNNKSIENPPIINHTFFDPDVGLVDIDERNMNLNLSQPDETNFNLNLIQNITQ